MADTAELVPTRTSPQRWSATTDLLAADPGRTIFTPPVGTFAMPYNRVYVTSIEAEVITSAASEVRFQDVTGTVILRIPASAAIGSRHTFKSQQGVGLLRGEIFRMALSAGAGPAVSVNSEGYLG